MQTFGTINDYADFSPIQTSNFDLPFLPPSFELIPRLLLLLDDSDTDSEKLTEVIKVDPGLTANVLHMSNTAALGCMRQVQTLQEAMLRLGLRGLYQVIMKVVASPVLNKPQHPSLAKLDLWRHSLSCAIGAQLIALQTGSADPEVAFTAGLLHDIGKVVLGQTAASFYSALIEENRIANRPCYAGERLKLRVDHAEIGARLLEGWKFPNGIVTSVRRHHEPHRAPEEHRSLAAILYAANIVAYRISEGYFFPDYVGTPDLSHLRLAGLDAAFLTSIEPEVQAQFKCEAARFL